jgi:uncharacterized protein YjbI with pentapeptide repeats
MYAQWQGEPAMADVTKQQHEIGAAPETASDEAQIPGAVANPRTGSTAMAFAAKARNLDTLRDAVVDAAAVSAGLWLSYLFVLFYLAIAVGGITHRDLFLVNPVKLPFLSIELPLVVFYALAPALFLIVHAYVLLHFVQFAEKLGVFDTELRVQISDSDIRARLHRQLPSNIFVQLLAGPQEMRTGLVGFMLWLIAHISLVIGPLALLILFLLKFLPYHDPITWWQRVAIGADLALLWILWPSVARGNSTRIGWRDIRNARFAPVALLRLLRRLSPSVARRRTSRNAWRVLRRGKAAGLALASLILLLLVVTVATYPGEWLDDVAAIRFIPTSSMGWVSLHELLFEVDKDANIAESLFANRLFLPDLDVIDHVKFDSEAKIVALSQSISLRNRHLENAVLSRANLRKANFSGAFLQGALLDGAQLQGANLDGANLQRASLDSAELQGASLIATQLQGASLASVQLQGATLLRAQLQFAYLAAARLQGSSLEEAILWEAVLSGADLQGSLLDRAQLQGADLSGAKLQGASLKNAFVWKAAPPDQAVIQDTLVDALETRAKYRDLGCELLACDWPPPQYVRRQGSRIESVKPEDEQNMSSAWKGLEKTSPTTDDYEDGLVDYLMGIGCESNKATYVIRQLAERMQATFDRWHIGSASLRPAQLSAAFLDEAHCFGAIGLSDQDKARLREIRNREPAAGGR